MCHCRSPEPPTPERRISVKKKKAKRRRRYVKHAVNKVQEQPWRPVKTRDARGQVRWMQRRTSAAYSSLSLSQPSFGSNCSPSTGWEGLQSSKRKQIYSCLSACVFYSFSFEKRVWLCKYSGLKICFGPLIRPQSAFKTTLRKNVIHI